jgi:AcrR family transcriptional regulator
MSTILTKRKILDSAVKLFNRDGFVNVRLQHIADEAFVSIGNMTYHYRNKDLIMYAIWEELIKKQKELLAEYRIVPLFEDIERQIFSTFQLQQEYLFFYLDTLEVMRAFPEIKEAHQKHIGWQKQQISFMIQFNISRGAFLTEIMPIKRDYTEGYQNELAQNYWAVSDFWLYRQSIIGAPLDDYANYRESIWSLLIPYFSNMGMKEYEQMNALISGNLL